MRGSLFFVLLFCMLPTSVPRAQEPPGAQPQNSQAVPLEQTPPEAPPGKSQKFEEEHPRIFWIFPTYTVAAANSVRPLTTRRKWQLFVKNETDPFTFGWVAFGAGIGQANHDLAGYGQGAAGYSKRFAAGLADEMASGFFGTFLFPSVLHQDPRYYRLGAGPFKRRLGHALIRTVLAHKDSGGRTFNWSGTFASVATSTLSNAYYPAGDRGLGATFSRVAWGIPFNMIDGLFNEFGPDLEKKILGKK
jgi:hypothetical protein